MEQVKEKKTKKASENTSEISYDQLKAYVVQMESQVKNIIQENNTLKQVLSARDMDYAFKCLDHLDLFSSEFITNVVKRLEEILNPEREIKQEDNSNVEENK